MRTLLILTALLVACNGKDKKTDDGGPTDGVDTDDTDTTVIDTDACNDRGSEIFCDGDVLVTCSPDGTISDSLDCGAAGEICDADAGACIGCDAIDMTVPYADAKVVAAQGIFVVPDSASGPFEERSARMRPLVVTGVGTLDFSGPLEVYAEDGTALTSGGIVQSGTVLVKATDVGSGAVTFTPDASCPGDPVAVDVTAGTATGLAGRALSGHPWFEDWDLFTDRDTVEASLDPAVWFDRVGVAFDAYVVPHRDPTEWAADADLTAEALVGPVTGAVQPGSIADGLLAVWEQPPLGLGLYESFDLVLDFGQDGTLDPGDLVDGYDEMGFAVSGDLAALGPHATLQGEISQDLWHTMRVYAPANVKKLDPMPLVAIPHGNGHDYTWYDYLGQHLASWGYVVMSHTNNTGPGTITAAATTWENTEVFLTALPTWQGGFLDGEVDDSRIVWIGHSRGGESVAIARHWLETGQANPTMYDASDLVLISSIAPTIFEGPDVVNPHDTPYHLIAGSADGDVNGGASCSICQFFRIFQRATNERTATYVQGADHNDFNCCGSDDFYWASNVGPPIGRSRAQQLAKSYWLAMLESQLNGHDVLGEYLVRATENFRPPNTDVVIASQHKRAENDRKFVIDDFQTNPESDLSSSGEAVTNTVRHFIEAPLDDGQQACVFGNQIWCTFTPDPADPMNGMTQADGDANPARGVVFEWDQGDDDLEVEFTIPAAERDLTDDAYLSFRSAQSTRHVNTVTLLDYASFSVALVDGAGNVSALDHRVYGGLTRPWARDGDGNGTGWANEFQSVRIPLSAFTADGRALDRSDVVAIRFLFGPSWGSELGRVGLDDIEILGEGVR